MIATQSEIRIIKLNCVSCGSTLDISQQMERLACGYCGTQQIVERSGGAIHLRGVAEAISKVQVGTDKTAAELAIARLSKEIEDLRFHRAKAEHNWLNVRTEKIYEWNAFLEGKKNTVNISTLLSGIFAAIPVGFIASLIYRFAEMILPTAEKAATFAVIIFLIGCVAVAVFVRIKMHKSDKYNPDKLQDQCNKEFAKVDRLIAKDLGEFDKRISALNVKIQQNYQIANS